MSVLAIRRPIFFSALVAAILALGLTPVSSASASEVKTKTVKTVKTVALKKAGRTNTSAVVNTLLHGIGAPSSSLGSNGDFYIDTIAMNIYGPKSKNAWPLPKSLIGPPGVAGTSGKAGVNGKDGANGKDGRDGSNGKDGDRGPSGPSGAATGGAGETGPAGPVGPQGPAGPAGPAGSQGNAGVAGAAGPAGATGAAGAVGAQGETGPRGLQGLQGIQGETGPRGLQGLQGLQGEQGTTGATGLTGAQGNAGATGAQGIQGVRGDTGPAGPVRIFTGSISFGGLLSGNVGTSIDSLPFANLTAGKKYFLRAQIYASSAANLNYYLSGSVFAFGASVTPVSNFTVQNGNAFRSSVPVIETVVSIFSTINGEGMTGSSYSLKVTIACGDSTNLAEDRLTLSGFFVLEEVSAIN